MPKGFCSGPGPPLWLGSSRSPTPTRPRKWWPAWLPGLAAERQFARRLAENGCEVLVPVLVDRQDTASGNRELERFTNQPHREWIYRQAFELGRHIIGYEVQKVMAAVDFFQAQSPKAEGQGAKIGVMGYAEGGLIALYSAALDRGIRRPWSAATSIRANGYGRSRFTAMCSGCSGSLATRRSPALSRRARLIIEHSPAPEIDGTPEPRPGRAGAAPGKITTPDYDSVETECERAQAILERPATPKDSPRHPHLRHGRHDVRAGFRPRFDGLAQFPGELLEQVKRPLPGPGDLREPGDPAGPPETPGRGTARPTRRS